VHLVDGHAVVQVAPRLGEDRLGADVAAEAGAGALDQRGEPCRIERHPPPAVAHHDLRLDGDRLHRGPRAFLGAPLAVEHVGTRDLVVTAAHQAKLDLVLHVLDVERAAARAGAEQAAHHRFGQRIHRLAHARRGRTLRAVHGEECLHQSDGDLVRLERDDAAVAAQDLVAGIRRRGTDGTRRGARHHRDGWGAGRQGGRGLHGRVAPRIRCRGLASRLSRHAGADARRNRARTL
jgi:hypothetical protein